MLKIPKFVLEAFGHIHLSKTPFFMLYNPKFHRLKGHEIRQILSLITPGDIVLRTFRGYLNTLFTPGEWGHAGLYVGENKVIHAIGEGVIVEDILDFCRTDSLAVLRVKDQYKHLVDLAIVHAEKELDARTGYDWEFISNNGVVYCSELVSEAYGVIFQEDYVPMYGRMAITPDGIANSKSVDILIEFKH